MEKDTKNTSDNEDWIEDSIDFLKDKHIRYIMENDMGIPIDDIVPMDRLQET